LKIKTVAGRRMADTPVLKKSILCASNRILEVSKDRDATNKVISVPPGARMQNADH
jgi:hypothetical protein